MGADGRSVTAAPAGAQETRATVTGTVKDAQGAIVPGVTVTVTNTDTNVSSEAVTNEAGVFTVQRIQPGPVKVTAALSGFKTFVRDGLTLHTAETVTLAIPLSVGAVEETVTVSAASQRRRVERDRRSSQTIENKRISELPLNGRQVYMLLQLTAGTLFTQTTFGASGFSGTRAWDVNGSLTIHGSRTGNNEFLIEGAPSAGTGGGTGLELRAAGRRDRGVQGRHVERRRVARPHQRRRRQHDAAIGHQRAARLGDRAPPRHLARLEPDPEHPQQHLERGAQVLQRRGDGQRADPPRTRRSSWAATRASTRTSRSR